MQSPLTQTEYGADPDYKKPPTINGKSVKPNKYPVCEPFYKAYYDCVLVKEASFGKFVGKCDELRMRLDTCNARELENARHRNNQLAKDRKKLIDERMEQLSKEPPKFTK
ncbi:hypothetical protein GUITHDRAFT_101528 [Guillardia theta CCMP2712]|uniref:COX assembly mitochondrial protein n=1 Tax=Guillardia theta (strain CCMP2712) TaxID=905079 RepID=L1JYA4_GUITC|nr:hypothetical protein GUITHDRAFT_101528 [Guillardia theta CCMP2712]EKX53083.1 hypothetical protein GUITHDRAFT_101528 [Guillardia theta CCMP2712]|mmetsp:Transcript_7151/g.24812  ORF Transcript_7151/g.24812 Transcript_7151/m.24812 type:complete len:110 (-) Transcript_7151:110-439(-)|eukprot:XP_005840063.1 hypothetical protein GUITHDRAFT_101528 [Guillardia theta CCMP2712]